MLVTVELDYNAVDDTVEYTSATNAKPEALPDILSSWIRTQFGAGEDNREATDRKKYRIRLELDLQGDVFHVSHNCGNDALCLGIVLNALRKLPERGARC